jgi:two-component system KDP operon response regulator KdpE
MQDSTHDYDAQGRYAMTNAMHRALLIEGDPFNQGALRHLLREQGCRVTLADNFARGDLNARSCRPDLIVAVVGEAAAQGIDFIRTLRVWSATPILVLSAHATLAQRLAVFDAGADDYVEVPFSSAEVAARTRALLRRRVHCDPPRAMLHLGDVCVDLERRRAQHRDGRKMHLTPIEHRILETLARYPDRIITHRQLFKEVWGRNMADLRVVRVYIASLRRKLEQNPKVPEHIVTDVGIGYRLALDLTASPDVIPKLTQAPTLDGSAADYGVPRLNAASEQTECL